MSFKRVFTNAPWEKKVGYCRVLKAGDSGKTHAPGNAYEQAKKCLQIIESSLAKLDVPISKIVRTRMFVTDISKWESFGRAHAEYFANNPPTTSMLEIKGLIDPEMMIEIEADAYAGKL